MNSLAYQDAVHDIILPITVSSTQTPLLFHHRRLFASSSSRSKPIYLDLLYTEIRNQKDYSFPRGKGSKQSMSTISSPPPATLDTPSPTEIDVEELATRLPPPDPTSNPDEMSSKPIYLVVATAVSPPLGIGFKGTLPWPQIKSDMAFFRKVTSDNPTTGSRNAVIMGRKTWESIPPKFRPLPGRINVILTRADRAGTWEAGQQIGNDYRQKEGLPPGEIQSGLDINIQGSRYSLTRKGDRQPIIQVTNSLHRAMDVGSHPECDKVFCIGGAEIYRMVLQHAETRYRARILQTQVRKLDGSEYECDTFFPEQIRDGVDGWKEASLEEVKSWVGTSLPQGEEEWAKDEKAGVEIKVSGWSRGEM